MSATERSPLIVRSDTDETNEYDDLEREYHQHNLALSKAPILFSLWMGSFLASIDNTVVANMMNIVSEEFKHSEQKQWIATSFLLTNTAFQPLYGKLSDLTGRKFALLCAHFFFGVGCFLNIFANSVTQFAIARAICGMGAGGLSAMSSITVSDICTAKERGVYQGYANLVYAIGQFLGAPLGGFLIEKYGWRVVFAGQIPLIISCFVFTWTNLNVKLAHVPTKGRFSVKNLSKIDIGGSISLIFVIGGILILTSNTEVGMSTFSVVCLTILSFVIFMLNELYWCKERIVPFEKISGKFGVVSILTLFSSFVTFGEIFRKPLYLQLLQNFSTAGVGFFTIFTSFASPVASFITGFILKHTTMDLEHCAYWLIAISFLFQASSLILESLLINYLPPNTGEATAEQAVLFFLDNSKVYWKFIIIFTTSLFYYGYCTLLVATLVSIVFTVDKCEQGTFTGLYYLWRSIGNVLGASLTLTIFEKKLDSSLFKYFSSIGNMKFYKDLVHDSSLVRKELTGTTLTEVLNIYNNSVILSYAPSFVVVSLSIVISTIFLRYVSKIRKIEGVKV